MKDPAFLEIVRAQHADISLKLELVASAVEAALREDYEYPIEVLREARLKLARFIDAEHRYVSVETLRGSKRFKLKNLAIPGRLFELEDRELESARVGEREHSIPYLAFRRQTA